MKQFQQMKTKGILIAGLVGVITSSTFAQAPVGGQTRDELRAQFEKRREALDRAVENRATAEEVIAVRKATADPSVRAKLEEAIKSGVPQPTAEELAAKRRYEEQMARAKANISEDSGVRVARPVAAPPAGGNPPIAPALPVDPVKPANFDSARPRQPDKVDIAPKDDKNQVKISSSGAAEFDSTSGVAIFTEDVIIEHPGFYMESDELEVHMEKGEEKPAEAAADAPAAPVEAEPAGAEAKEDTGGGIKVAIARGRRVMLKKLSEDGKLQIGYCRKAIFDGATGNLEMHGNPQIQKGNQILMAKNPDTVIIIEKDGKLKTNGKQLTILPAKGGTP